MMDGACVRVCTGGNACASRAVQQLQSCYKLTSIGRDTRIRRMHWGGGGEEADGRDAPVTEVELVSDALLISIWLHFRLLGAILTHAFLFPPRRLLQSGPTFFGGVTWMEQHSLAAAAGVRYGMRGNMTGKEGGRWMRPASRVGNHPRRQATLRFMWKSPRVMHSGALRKALPSWMRVNKPALKSGNDATKKEKPAREQ